MKAIATGLIGDEKRLTWWLAGVAVVAAMLVLARQFSYGVGLSGDFAAYLGTASNIIDGNGFVVKYNGAPYVYWPPLYPLLLAAATFGGFFNVFDVAGPLNAVSVGLAVFIVGQVLRRHVASAWAIFWCAALAVAPSIGDIAAKAMSEALFMLCVIAALAVAYRHLETTADGDHRVLLGLGAATVAALAALTRWFGICVTLFIALLLFFAGNAPLVIRAWRAFYYVAVALAPVGLWLLLNRSWFSVDRIEERFAGQREYLAASDWDFAEVLGAYFAEIANWGLLDTLEDLLWQTFRKGIFPMSLNTVEGWLLVAGAAFISVCLVILAFSVAIVSVRWLRRVDLQHLQPIHLAYCVFGGFSVVYLIVIIAAQTMMGFSPLGWRYALPMFPPLLISVVLAGKMLRRLWHVSALVRVGTPLLLLWLCAGVAVNGKRIWAANSEAVTLGLASPKWRDSATLAYVRSELGGQRFYTNNPRAVFAHTAHENYGSLERSLELAKRQIESLPEGAYIVAMLRTYHYGYTNAELRELNSLVSVAELSDGVVFRVARTEKRK